MSNMKPNFTQGHLITSLQRENQMLHAQAQAMAQTSRLIEAAVSGLCVNNSDPKDIANKAVQIAGAVIIALEQLSQPEGEPNGGTPST